MVSNNFVRLENYFSVAAMEKTVINMPPIRAMQINPIAPLAKAVEATLSKVTQIWNAKRIKLFHSQTKTTVDNTSQHISIKQQTSELSQKQMLNSNVKKRKLNKDESHSNHNSLMADKSLPRPANLSISQSIGITCQYYVVAYFLSSHTYFDQIILNPEIIEMTVILVNAKTRAIQNIFHAICRPQNHSTLSSVRLITSQISQVGRTVMIQYIDIFKVYLFNSLSVAF